MCRLVDSKTLLPPVIRHVNGKLQEKERLR